MIKFGIREYVEHYSDGKSADIISDIIVAYTENDEQIGFSTDMSQYINQYVKLFYFNKSGSLYRKSIAKLRSIKPVFIKYLGKYSWRIEVEIVETIE